jgi:hypothetical protein
MGRDGDEVVSVGRDGDEQDQSRWRKKFQVHARGQHTNSAASY